MKSIKEICFSSNYRIDNVLIAPFSQTKYLVLSSTSFLCPCYISYKKDYIDMSLFILMTYLISINYWRDCKYSWRRNIDLFWSRLALIVFSYNGYHYLENNTKKLSASLFPLLTYCFYKSTQFKQNWYKYHFIFHLIGTCEMIIIINNI